VLALPDDGSAKNLRSAEARLDEATGLAEAIGIDVVDRRAFRLRGARPATLFGKGQAEAIAEMVGENDAGLLIVDAALSPVQQKSLEDITKTKVIDRTGLILEIFGERAATAEGRLQVELAHLDYQAGRLVRSWTHLERQRGGFGFLGGPGETQIEADRRLIRDRMAKIRRELEQVKRTRGLHRDRRQRAPWPVIALVGYTNAGKSTLFNRMTRATVMAENLLFATLDPTLREIRLPGFDKAILSDTVGFISDLPTQLVAAFRATLEEVTAADVIVHVRDIANPDTSAQKKQVLEVLADLGVLPETQAGEGEPSIPIVEVWNKADLLSAERIAELAEEAERRADERIVTLSALTGEGCDGLLALLSDLLTSDARPHVFVIPAAAGQQIAWLHANGEVTGDEDAGEGEGGPLRRVTVRLTPKELGRFSRLS